MLLRSSKKYSQDVSLNDPIGTDRDGNEIVIMDVISADSDTIAEQVDLKIQTKKLYEKLHTVLKDRERLVIEMRYGLNGEKEVTQQEIAKILGISRSYVSRIEKKALKKLNSEMNS
jgi:RNA polymerase sporulation-specific sigma factor